ncbi:MAG: DMT family transporter [Acutalibacter sp.]|nr:DMT family transporter [Acutalibacter sp.]
MEHKDLSKMGPLCVILSAILFGMMPLFTKVAYAFGCSTDTAAMGRFLFGGVGLWIVITASPKLSFHVTKQEFLHILLLSLPFCATTFLLYGSYSFISSGLATTLHFTYPVVVMVLSMIFFHTKLQARQLICLLICAAGILCLYRPGGNTGMKGIVMALLSGVTYSIYILLLGKIGLKRLHVLTVTFWLCILSLLEIGAVSIAGGEVTIPTAWQAWAAMAGLGLSASVAALALFQIGVSLCGEVKASLLSTFEPLTGVVIGIVVFNESLTAPIAAGILLILCSAVLLVISPEKKQREAQYGKST